MIGSLGSITKEFDRWIEKLGITCNFEDNFEVIEESVADPKKRSLC